MQSISQDLNNPDHLSNFFPGAKLIGNAVDDIPSFKELHANFDANGVAGEILPLGMPMIQTVSGVREAYQNLDYDLIKQMENVASQDLNYVFQNMHSQGMNAFRRIELNGKPYYATWTNSGMVWSCTESVTPLLDPNLKYSAVVQFGTYSANTKIAGISRYNLKLPDMLVESVIASAFVKLFSGFVVEGLGFVASAFAARLGSILATWGIELTITMPEIVLPIIAACIVFTIVFVGLSYLWNWMNKRYTFRTQVFNWDQNNIWGASGQYCDNAVMPGQDGNSLGFSLPKMLPPGTVITPPGFGPNTTLDTVVSYAVLIYCNDSTFLRGNAMSVKFKLENGDTVGEDGFMWVFNNPRFNDNQMVILSGVQDPQAAFTQVYENNLWDPNPIRVKKPVSQNNNNLTYGVDYLSGAPDDLYNIIININPPY
ncbi:hypothetical protein CYY_007008 [Polysphondylium violaceum]|uniref:Uncharacterized protein n=1 Tax=Polysphondylium violaceum TaxID=133409 RepID=A0A8J4PRJ9_9MYCE|nr:hypothetical protein CYY_007008 [Polysphondylium violaceum]